MKKYLIQRRAGPLDRWTRSLLNDCCPKLTALQRLKALVLRAYTVRYFPLSEWRIVTSKRPHRVIYQPRKRASTKHSYGS